MITGVSKPEITDSDSWWTGRNRIMTFASYQDAIKFWEAGGSFKKSPFHMKRKNRSKLKSKVTMESIREFVKKNEINEANLTLHGCHCLINDFVKDIVIDQLLSIK